MGSETGDTDEKPVHKVTITRPFYLGRCEVTQAQWQAVMGACPSSNQGPDFPVTNVTWDDCRQFCQKLNESVGGALRAANGFRLPTEAEWEYACRAGTTTVFCFGDDGTGLGEYAWFDGNARDCLREVGTRKPNAWGLCDMHGNVWEWCSDWKGDYSAEAATDPPGPVHGVCRVCRGGSWVDVAGVFRSANRAGGAPGSRVGDIGLRVAFAPAVQQ
jgi:formylglycine-generating enzyme required for sulfatase activity